MRVLRPERGTSNNWRYVQPESGMVLNGPSYWNLLDRVLKHREAMGYDLSEGWESRFQHDLCLQNDKVLCAGKKAKSEQRRLSLADLKRFMNTISNFNGEFVPAEEAERRASICSTCPLNQGVAGCWGCAGVVAETAKLLSGRTTTRDKALESCSVCGCVMRAKVHLPLDVVDNTGLEYPTWCWQHTPQG